MNIKRKKYYVYVFYSEKEGTIYHMGKEIKIVENQPYYVGKGTGYRATSKNGRNVDTQLFMDLFGCKAVMHKEKLTEEEALECEYALIKELEIQSIPLTNRSMSKLRRLPSFKRFRVVW